MKIIRRCSSCTLSLELSLSVMPSSPAAEQWLIEFAQSLPQLQQLSGHQLPAWQLRVLRSSQLDAQRLDAELHTMLQEQFMAVFQLLPQGLVSSLGPELNLLLAGVVFWLSVWQGRASPGSELMNLRYRNESAMAQAAAAAATAGGCEEQGAVDACVSPRAHSPSWLHGGRSGVEGPNLSFQQRIAYALGFVALPYVWLRANRYAASSSWGPQAEHSHGQIVWHFLRVLDRAHKLCVLANHWVFLYEGKYRTLVERFIGARLVYRQPDMTRLVSFEYLNRQLVWQELSEFLLFLLPLIDVSKVRRTVLQLLPKMPVLASSSYGGRSAGVSSMIHYPVAEMLQPTSGPAAAAGHSSCTPVPPQQQSDRVQQPQTTLQAGHSINSSNSREGGKSDSCRALPGPVGPCPICNANEILVPFLAHPCGHVFCYYCLQSHCSFDSQFQCPVDGLRVDALQRYKQVVLPSSV